jgi:hypothetical protein
MGKNKGAARKFYEQRTSSRSNGERRPCLERVTPQAVAAQRVTSQAVATKAVTAQRMAAQAVTAGHSDLPIATAFVPRERPASAALGATRITVVAAAATTAEMPATRRREMVLRMRYFPPKWSRRR